MRKRGHLDDDNLRSNGLELSTDDLQCNSSGYTLLWFGEIITKRKKKGPRAAVKY
jgi:hypothetical protein